MDKKFEFEGNLISDEKIRENLRKLYSNLAKDIESVNYDTYKVYSFNETVIYGNCSFKLSLSGHVLTRRRFCNNETKDGRCP